MSSLHLSHGVESSKCSQEALAEGKTSDSSLFHRAAPGDHVRELFEVAWAPLLATFSVLLEQYGTTDSFRDMMMLCLEAFKHSIRVLSLFFMETERDAFVTALAKFTQLGELDSLREATTRTPAHAFMPARTCTAHIHTHAHAHGTRARAHTHTHGVRWA